MRTRPKESYDEILWKAMHRMFWAIWGVTAEGTQRAFNKYHTECMPSATFGPCCAKSGILKSTTQRSERVEWGCAFQEEIAK